MYAEKDAKLRELNRHQDCNFWTLNIGDYRLPERKSLDSEGHDGNCPDDWTARLEKMMEEKEALYIKAVPESDVSSALSIYINGNRGKNLILRTTVSLDGSLQDMERMVLLRTISTER